MEPETLRLILAVLTIDPAGIGGLWLRARAGPERQRLLEALPLLPLPFPLQRLASNITDEALFGGLDSAATLRAGRPVMRQGLLNRAAVLVLPMAERCAPDLSARLAQALDARHHAIVALDETADEGEGLPQKLADRLGLFLDLDSLRLPDRLPLPDADEILAARVLLPTVRVPHDAVAEVVRACADLMILSTRAPILTLAAARALAALAGRTVVERADLMAAAALTLAHRAAPLGDPPDSEPPPQPDTPPSEDGPDDSDSRDPDAELPQGDIMVDAVRAALPDQILRDLAEGRAQRQARGASGSGAARTGNRRGRPLPSRRGLPKSGSRIDLIATLRAAAPWQTLRRIAAPDRAGQALLVDPSDLHIKRAKILSDRVLVFAVDASGSAAVARLAEAKGAVEQLLARAYSRRDHVALLTFRGQAAELLLPPTRSLVMTKARLRGVPGGGATPLAGGLRLALDTALRARAHGMTPTIALLTDGRGNVALDGSADRGQSDIETTQMARAIRATGCTALVIDTAQRPQPRLVELARNMGARYLALPRVGGGRLAAALGASLDPVSVR